MKTYLAVFSALVFVSLLSVSVLAQDDLVVTLSPSQLTLNTSETKVVQIKVQNNRNVEDMFSLTVFPDQKWNGVTPSLEKYQVRVPAKSEFTSNLFLTASSDAEEVVTSFKVAAQSLSNATIIDSADVRVDIMRKSAVYISSTRDDMLDKSVVNPNDILNIVVIVLNAGDADSLPMSMQINIRTDTEILKRFDYNLGQISSISTKVVETSYEIGEFTSAGAYSVEALLKDPTNSIVSTKTATFTIQPVKNLVEGSSVSYSIFSETKTITVTNNGNTVEQGFYVTESVPSYTANFFYPDREPDKAESKDNRMVYSWYVESLAPGSSVTIKYEIRFFAIWFIGILVIAVVIVGFRYAYSLRIVKRHSVEGEIEKGKEITISLEVRNPTLHEIKNVTISDYVPTIATLVDRFDTMRPTVRKMDQGTELTWRVKSLKPMEERVLTYRIKPLVDVIGTIRMPRASINYLDRKQRRKAVASKTMIIRGK